MADALPYFERILTSIGAGGATAALLVYLWLRYGRMPSTGSRDTPLVPPAVLRAWLDEQRDRLRDMEHALERVQDEQEKLLDFVQQILPEAREQTRLLRQIDEHLGFLRRFGRMIPGS